MRAATKDGARFFVMAADPPFAQGELKGHTVNTRTPIVIALTPNIQLLGPAGSPLPSSFHIRREDIEPLLASGRRAVRVRPVSPLFAVEVGLEAETSPARRLPPDAADRNGALVIAEIRSAVISRTLGQIRRLCAWFPYPSLYMPETHALLESLPRQRAAQVAGKAHGKGRPTEPLHDLRLIASVEMLRHEKAITIAEAARRVATAAGLVTPARLANLHAELGPLARCLAGYRIPESEAPCLSWRERADDSLAVYVLNASR